MTLARKIRLATLRFLVRTIGRTSEGIRISFRDGFVSGVMLEYVYRNRAHGRLLIGRIIDRMFLSHPGWEVVRKRKQNLEILLRKAIERQRLQARQPIILDVASGPAAYLLDVLADAGMDDVRAVCRDLDERALAQGQKSTEARRLDRIRFEKGDALSADSFATLAPKPNIVVSSGFYDWLTEDALIHRSMALIAATLPDGGSFVFTNQSGHFDLEMTQKLFIDLRGEPLQMVTRPVDLMNGWCAENGFVVEETLSDEQGHYAASLAHKRTSTAQA